MAVISLANIGFGAGVQAVRNSILKERVGVDQEQMSLIMCEKRAGAGIVRLVRFWGCG